MAYIQPRECRACGETKNVNVHAFNGLCPQCRSEQEDAEKRQHLAGLKGLTVEERLERLEELFYDMDVDARLKSLEHKTATYA